MFNESKYNGVTPTGKYIGKKDLPEVYNVETGELGTLVPHGSGVILNTEAKREGFKNKKRKEAGRSRRFTLINNASVGRLASLISEKDLGRLLFVQSYMNYTGMLVLGAGTTERPMTKVELRNLLGIKQETFKKFLDCLIVHNILSVTSEGYLFINLDYYFKGSSKKKNVIKCFDTNIQVLYRDFQSNPKLIGFIYKLLPYVNYHYNCLCYNTWEKNPELIQFLRTQDIVRLTGVSQKTVYNRFRELHCQSMFIFNEGVYNSKYIYRINPFFFYRLDGEPLKERQQEFGRFYINISV